MFLKCLNWIFTFQVRFTYFFWFILQLCNYTSWNTAPQMILFVCVHLSVTEETSWWHIQEWPYQYPFIRGQLSKNDFLEAIAGHLVAHRITYMKTAMQPALMSPEMGTVTNQAMKMFLKRCQSTDFLERSHPTATTEPTCAHTEWLTVNTQASYFYSSYSSISVRVSWILSFITLQWVVLTGRPMLDATTTVSAEASSMLNPLDWKKKHKCCGNHIDNGWLIS